MSAPDPNKLYDRVQAAAEALKKICPQPPKAAVILGTGLGGLAEKIQKIGELPYGDVPNLPVSTVESHAGRVVSGTLGDVPVVAFDGRFHLYEGWTPEQVTMPVRVAKALGAQALFLSGAVGGMNPLYKTGDVILLDDHINMLGVNPLVGPNDERLGPRFPDMCRVYDEELLSLAEKICLEEKIRGRRGVYVSVLGPNLETRAEYRMLRCMGADVVGMSTVPEAIVAVHSGLRVFAASIVTDLCFPEALKPANIDEIIAVANKTEPSLTRLVERLIVEM